MTNIFDGWGDYLRRGVAEGRYEVRTCEGLTGRPCGAEVIVWHSNAIRCGICQRTHWIERRRAMKKGERDRARGRRAAASPPCEVCGGALWPEGEVPARARRDRKTCSDRCRQALRRSGRRSHS